MKKLFKSSLSLILVVILFLFASNLFSQYWSKISGTSLYVNGIFLDHKNPQSLIVSSDDVPTDFSEQNINFPYFGVGQNGYRISTDGGVSFSDPILIGYSVYNIHQAATNKNLWFASVRRFTLGGVLISNNAGQVWGQENLKCPGSHQITKIISKTDNTNQLELFASAVNTDEGFKYSLNNFEDCLTNENLDIQSLDISISPLDENIMFIAGDGFHNLGVFRSNDNGKSWLKDSSGLENKRVLCVLPSSFNKAWVLCGVDSVDLNKFRYGKGVYLSQDTGKSWKPVGAFGSTVFSLAQHPLYPKFIAAACDKQGVYLSGSFGWSWEKFSDGIPKDSSVRHVAIPAIDSTNEGIIVYAGVFGDGIYKSRRIKTDVESPKNLVNNIEIYPNPTLDVLNIQNINENHNIMMTDILGNNISFESKTANNNLIIDLSKYPSGVYLIYIYDGLNYTSKRVIKIN